MKAKFIKQGDTSLLTLFFAGWGMDANPFADYVGGRGDLLVLYDYTDLDFDVSLLSGYDACRVTAWSMGVWAAACTMPSIGVEFTESIAVAGTTTPVSDGFGISTAVFKATLDNMSAKSVESFRRRMCGGASAAAKFAEHLPARDVGSLHDELRAIGEAATHTHAAMTWSKAIVTGRDAICAPAAQEAAHRRDGTAEIVTVEAPHYDDTLLRHVIETV